MIWVRDYMGDGLGGLQFSRGGDRRFSLFSVLDEVYTLHPGSRIR